jgi:hypothetical protein
VEIIGLPKFTIVQVIQQQDKLQDGHYTIDNNDLAKNRNEKVRIQIFRSRKPVVLYRKWSNVEKKSQVIMITEEQVVGFLDGNASFG